MSAAPDPIPEILEQHVAEAADLRRLRSSQVCRPRLWLSDLWRLDERITAHLDGIAAAGAAGNALVQRELFERPGVGEVFVATVQAVEAHDAAALQRLLALTQTLVPARAGLLSGLGWVSAGDLRGTAKALLDSGDPWLRAAGLTACAMHRVDPGVALDQALHDPDAELRARALHIVARLGRRDLLDACREALADPEPACADAAVRSSVLLGNRSDALSVLERRVLAAPIAETELAAWRLLLAALPPSRSRLVLAGLARDPTQARAAIHGIAIAGDPHYVPWLIARMDDLALARLAGDAFTCITGAELAVHRLARQPEQDASPGPLDDDGAGPGPEPPGGPIVPIGDDDDLPWPDAAKVAAWWHANAVRFAPGQRHLLGRLPTQAVCLEVLRDGTQRQRRAAADCLTLLAPGTPLFNTAAPAWRQAQWLARHSV